MSPYPLLFPTRRLGDGGNDQVIKTLVMTLIPLSLGSDQSVMDRMSKMTSQT
jgi:hypothetical protein